MNLDIPIPTTRRRYADDYIIVYLDTYEDEVNLVQLTQLGFSIESFTDSNECIDFVTRLKDKQVFCLIIDQLVEHNILFLNHSPLVASIYVIYTNKRSCELCTKDYPKVKGVYGDILSITEALKRDIKLAHRNSTPITILSSTSSSQPTNILNSMFMYCELLKDTFLEMNHGEKAKKALIDLFKREYADNETALRMISEFDQDYTKHSPTWWYTRNCFVYRMLNKALRTYDTEVIITFGFFIKDLHCQLQELHRTLLPRKLTLYRGQSMSIEEFVKLKENIGGLISFNSFLSTSADKDVSLIFALSTLNDMNAKAIFYIIHVDFALISSPVGYLDENLSYFSGEKEYLWGMNTIFRINGIVEVENGLCQVHLAVTNEDDSQLRQLMEYKRKECGILSGMQRLGNLMIEMGEWNKAKDIYETLLQEEEDPCIILQLGFIAHRMNDSDEAIRHYEHTLSILSTNLPSDDSCLAPIHSNIGCVLKDKGNFKEAYKQFQRALELERRVENPNKENIARIHNNIATLLEIQGNHTEALENMESTLKVFLECLPPTHPEVAATYSNIATLYYKIKNYSNALINYRKCLDIQKASLPSDHPDLLRTNEYMQRTTALIQQRANASRHVRNIFDSAYGSVAFSHLRNVE